MKIPKRPGFAKIRKDLHGDFSPNAHIDAQHWLLYQFMVEQANWADHGNLARYELNLSIRQLASALGLSRCFVERALERFKDLDYIEITDKGSNKIAQTIRIKKCETQSETQSETQNATQNPLELQVQNSISQTQRETQLETQSETSQKMKKKMKKKEEILCHSANDSDDPATHETNLKPIDAAAIWNSRLPSHTQNQITLLAKNPKRLARIKALLETVGIDGINAAIEKISASSFLSGKNDRGWKPNFLWLTNMENYQKVVEGNFDDLKTDKQTETGSTGELRLIQYNVARKV